MRILILFSALCTVLLPACTKDSSHAAVSFHVRTVNRYSLLSGIPAGGGGAAARPQQGTLTWLSGYANVTEISFEASGGADDALFSSEAAQRVDLFAPVVVLGDVKVRPGAYEEVDFEITLYGNAGSAALELVGDYKGTRVIFRLEGQHEIEGELPGVFVAAETDYTSLTSLDLSRLATAITSAALDNAARDGAGNILISASSNPDLYQVMVENIQDLDEEDFH